MQCVLKKKEKEKACIISDNQDYPSLTKHNLLGLSKECIANTQLTEYVS